MELINALYKLKKSLISKRRDDVFSKKIAEFEEVLETNSNLTDNEACKLLYGSSHITVTYRSLKYRVEEKLMNDLLNLCSDEENLKTRVNAGIVLDKMIITGQALQKQFFRKEAILIFEKSFKLAEKFSFSAQALHLGQALAMHYGYIETNEKKMTYYLEKNNYYLNILNVENYVRECNVIISNMYLRNVGGFNENQLEEIRKMVSKMNELKEEFKSNTIVGFVNDLTYFYYQSIGDYHKGLEAAKKGLEENIHLNNDDLLGIYQSKRNIALSLFHLRQYEEASIWYKKVISMLTSGTRNWFFATSLYYLNLISIRSYDELFKLSTEVLNNKNLVKFPYFEEQWKIREAYLHFLIRVGKINIDKEDKKVLKPFSLSKFMNSLPFHSKDKSGQNITIIVLQILFLLTDHKYGQIIDRIDALNQYTYRYLRKDETFRSNCFIKMLVLMTKADFHPIRTNTYTEDLRKKLENSSLITDEKSTQVEIIPYDYLWDLILELLASKKNNVVPEY